MNKDQATIFIVDDDHSVRRSLSLFLIEEGYIVETFPGAEEFIARDPYEGVGCLILDINMKRMSGLGLQEELSRETSNLPVIFITGYGDVRKSVTAIKMGAVNFLEKPFSEEDLLKSISEALDLSRHLITENEDIQTSLKLINTLTPREYEVCKYVMSGMLNKQIAYELNITEQTVKIHRHNLLEKLGVKSVPEIIRIADKAGVIPFENKY